MTAARSTPYYDMRVWDKQSYGSISFSHKDTEAPFLGHIMELGVIQGALVDRLKEFENVQLLCPEKILKIEFPPETHPGELVTVTTTKNGKLKTRLLVGADGANSFVRTEAGIGLSTVGYNQRGVVATLETTEPHSTAWQRFLPTGPIALLPLHDNYSSIVWSTNPYQAETLLDHTDQQFLDGINFAFNSPPSYRYTTGFLSSSLDKVICDFLGERKDSHMPLPKITKLVGPRAAFPLRMSHAQNYVRPRLALIGDAGHTVHPLAGQGINLGFADVITLTRIIQEAIESGSDIGDINFLQQYESIRRQENFFLMAGMDGIKRLFDFQFFPAVLLRSVGLQVVNSNLFMKRFFQNSAAGGNYDLNRIGIPREV
eukprot:TRINITY_DN2502_c0_g1_i26.p1 TRINITY_DN2502_c0_g1~~TRINITY_DN2502_c0_g1_i26.p1  ORF type:complete len:372 (-),score=53.09 TRINITY_DN2502_c0_g1_i26:186-1301(-)